MAVVLRVPKLTQSHTSANCGPCSLKMILDYYGVRRVDDAEFSLMSVNRLLRVTREFGCEKSDFWRVIRRLGLKAKKIRFSEIERHIDQRIPIVALFLDTDGIGHYSVIVGYTGSDFLLNDPWENKRTRYSKAAFRRMIAPYSDWLLAITAPSECVSPSI